MTLGDPLKPVDRVFIDEYLTNGGNATRAELKVKETFNRDVKDSSLPVLAHKRLNKVNVQSELIKQRRSMREIFDEKGMTDAAVADILLDGAKNAKKFFIKGDKLASVDDYSERRQYTKLISDMKELFPDSSIKIAAGDGSNVQINIMSGKGYNAETEPDNISRPTILDASSEGSIVGE